MKERPDNNLQPGLKRALGNFNAIGNKDPEDLRVVSYNITADFFDRNDKTPEQIHTWSARAPYVKEVLQNSSADIICLQELSPNQALELSRHFGDTYQSFFLSQTPSEIENGTGMIVHDEQVGDWVGKNIGTPMVGTFVSKDFVIQETGRFWLNETPNEVPIHTDRGTTDKGFGNKNTYRAVLWAKLQHQDTDEPLFVFNSHYPLSGGNDTRAKCAEIEARMIQEIAGDNHWMAMGDRNTIDDLGDPHKVYEALHSRGGHDVRDANNHYGISHTFLGFSYDNYKTNLEHRPESPRHTTADFISSNLVAKKSFHDPAGITSTGLVSVGDRASLEEIASTTRRYASDHAAIGADFPQLKRGKSDISRSRR